MIYNIKVYKFYLKKIFWCGKILIKYKVNLFPPLFSVVCFARMGGEGEGLYLH
jgi:hypothetical protein